MKVIKRIISVLIFALAAFANWTILRWSVSKISDKMYEQKGEEGEVV